MGILLGAQESERYCMQPTAQGRLLLSPYPTHLLGITRPCTPGILGPAPSPFLQHPFQGQRKDSGESDRWFTDELKDWKLGVPWSYEKQVQVGC